MSGEFQAPDNLPPRVIYCYPLNRNESCAVDKTVYPCAQSTPLSSRILFSHLNHLRVGVIVKVKVKITL